MVTQSLTCHTGSHETSDLTIPPVTQSLTCYTGSHETSDYPPKEGPEDNLSQVALSTGGHGSECTELDPDRAQVGKSTQSIGSYDL